ncbi:MAG: glutamate--tRNA ligase [Planctomycetes bacterium]|nr:glutamate--tRNA ligase [Planctomycetota bacterium]
MTDIVRTRFAPSPTGYLHIGGARTALFNYLLARRLGGKFVLRIEDTDQTRNIAGAEQKLLDDMRWLGLDWDEGPEVGGEYGPYYQSQRLERYGECAERLLEAGRAYYAFDTREELDAMRTAAREKKQNFRYPRPASFPSKAEAERARADGRTVVIRYKMSGKTYVIADAILGDVTVQPEELDDFVIVKSDGWPTYNFAVVIDDEDMRITHVLRGQEHLLNTAKQVDVQDALGFAHPTYCHLPIILNMDGSKMSKREKDKAVRAAVSEALKTERLDEARVLELSGCADEKAFAAWRKKKTQLDNRGLARLASELAVELPEIEIHDFRVSGYLPEALLNFIALLGWSAGDDREAYTLAELCDAFSVERVGKANAKFDRIKLLSFNTTAAGAATPERLLAALRDYLAVAGGPLSSLDDATLSHLLELCRGFRTFRELDRKCGPIFVDDENLTFDESAVKKVLLKGDGAGLQMLRRMKDVLGAVEPWSPAALEQAITEFAETNQLGLGKVAQPVRVAVTGTTISPPIFDTLELLGRERTLTRIEKTLTQLN